MSPDSKLTNFPIKGEKRNKVINYKYPGVKIGIIMPAYNEEKNICRTLSDFPNNISDCMDIIVIDDGSVDNTCKIIQDYDVILIKHRKNRGNGAAIQTGLEFCKQNNYDIAVILDADGQHDPNDLQKFIDPIVSNKADFVIGNRFKYYYDMKILKKLLSRVMSVLYSFLLQEKIADPTMGYRALSGKIFSNLKFDSNYSITQEMLFKIIPKYSFKQVNTKIYEREFGESFINIKKYLEKTIFSVIKYYIFPKFKKIFNLFLKNSNIEEKLNKIIKT